MDIPLYGRPTLHEFEVYSTALRSASQTSIISETACAASTPVLTKESKKRELSSPVFDSKKKRFLSDFVSESEISGLEAEKMTHMEADEMSATSTVSTGSSQHLT